MPRPIDTALAARRALILGRVFVVGITLGFTVLLGRVVQLQTRPPEKIAALRDSQFTQARLLARRGNLEDRLGRPLATSRVDQALFIDPGLIDDPSDFSERVAYTIGLDPARLEQRLSPRLDKRYVLIEKRLSDDMAEKAKTLDLEAVGLEDRLYREYPQGDLAGQVVGFVNADGQGVEGVERLFDRELRGTHGLVRYLRDVRHGALWVDADAYRPPVDGGNVRLSLDVTIQHIAQTELAKACREFSAKSGELVVLDPRSGEILAMATYPLLDPNTFGSTPADLRRNRAVTDTYEPGSTFKPFLWSMATEQRFARPSELINCTESGFIRFASGRRMRDSHPNGLISWSQVLEKSSNIGMGLVAQRMGAAKVHAAAAAFGFGRNTASRLPGEVNGTLHPLRKWTSYSLTSIPIGQEISVTVLQMARGYSVFANGGYLPTPTIRAVDPRDPQATALLQRVLQPDTADLTRKVLRQAVLDGTGRNADSPLYQVFGKTGTAQIPAANRRGYDPGQYVGSFIGGAPYDKPRLVVACAIHRPNAKKGYYGGTIAAPAVRRVIEQSLLYLGVPPEPPAPDDRRYASRVAQVHYIDD